jgi:molybdopterin-guanine dinucleotide biosynthesis protein A
MGRDKALVAAPSARPLVRVGVDALSDAGALDTVVVGGAQVSHEAAGLRWIPDRYPGEGPLGGILTALHHASADVVVILACDMPGVGAEVPAALVEALAGDPTAAVAVAVADDREQPLTAAWRRSIALPELEIAFAAGERAPRRAMSSLPTVRVVGLPPAQLADVDSIADLHRYAERHSPPNEKD